MPNYSDGKIYKISSPNCDKVYIGSTTLPLYKRFSCHLSQSKLKSCKSYLLFDFGNCSIELIENFPCESRIELYRREGEIQKTYKNLCNNNLSCGRFCT